MKADKYFSKFPFAELSSQDGTSRLKFCSYAYEYPDVKNGSDADWHRNYILFTTPAFCAEIDEVCFEGGLLEIFLKDLKALSALRKTKVECNPTEPYISLSFSFNMAKRILVKGFVQYPVGIGAKLIFDFETDLTYLDQFIVGIEAILAAFPQR